MKKTSLTLTALAFVALISCTFPANANLIDNPTFKTHYIKFTTPASKIDANGVEIYVYNPIGGTHSQVNFVSDVKTGKMKVTYGATNDSDNYGDKKDVMTAVGLYVQFINNNSTPAVISWKSSSISAGNKNYGIPFLEGMKYKDAGNPSVTPDTIIPPGQKITKRVFIPDVNFVGSQWIQNGITVTPSKDINMTLVLSVNNQFVTNVTPGINFVIGNK